MTATRLLLAAVLATFVAAPAQALEEEADRLFVQCLETWPDAPSKQVACVSEALDRTVGARDPERYEGLTPQEVREKRVEMLMDTLEQLLMDWLEQSIKHEQFLDSPPLQCADAEANDFGLACNT